MILILLSFLLISDTSAENSNIYGGTLDHIYFNAYENRPLLENLTDIDFPAVKVNLKSVEEDSVHCVVKPSYPEVRRTSTYTNNNNYDLLNIFPIDDYIYLVYKNLSVSILKNDIIDKEKSSGIDNVLFIDGSSFTQTLYNSIAMIYLERLNLVEILTDQEVFVFELNKQNGHLKFLKKFSPSYETLDRWSKHQVHGNYLYITYKHQNDKVIVFSISNEGDFNSQQDLMSGGPIIDFHVSDYFLYMLTNEGIHIYKELTKEVSFISLAKGLRIIEDNFILVAVTEEVTGSYKNFHIIEYDIINIDTATFAEYNRRTFSGEFDGILDVSSSKVLVLNKNAMFVWYHSIKAEVQVNREELINSFLFNGETSFIRPDGAYGDDILYTQLGNEILAYNILDNPPQMQCNVASLMADSNKKINFEASLASVLCTAKMQNDVNTRNSLCVYNQAITITKVSNSTKLGAAVSLSLLSLGLLIIISLTVGLIYYLRKYNTKNALLQNKLRSLKSQIDRINKDEESSSSLFKDVTQIVNNLAAFSSQGNLNEDGRIEEKVSHANESSVKKDFVRLLPTMTSVDSMRTSLAAFRGPSDFIENEIAEKAFQPID